MPPENNILQQDHHLFNGVLAIQSFIRHRLGRAEHGGGALKTRGKLSSPHYFIGRHVEAPAVLK